MYLAASKIQSCFHLINIEFVFLVSYFEVRAERDSFGSVRDFRALSAIHLIQFGTSQRESFGSVRVFRALII